MYHFSKQHAYRDEESNIFQEMGNLMNEKIMPKKIHIEIHVLTKCDYKLTFTRHK